MGRWTAARFLGFVRGCGVILRLSSLSHPGAVFPCCFLETNISHKKKRSRKGSRKELFRTSAPFLSLSSFSSPSPNSFPACQFFVSAVEIFRRLQPLLWKFSRTRIHVLLCVIAHYWLFRTSSMFSRLDLINYRGGSILPARTGDNGCQLGGARGLGNVGLVAGRMRAASESFGLRA